MRIKAEPNQRVQAMARVQSGHLRGRPARDHLPTEPVINPAISVILALQRTAGNQAVTAMLEAKRAAPAPGIQRAIGWKDASTEGYGWNVQEHKVGKIRRFPLEGLAQGLQQESAKRWVRGKGKEKGHWADESTMLAGLSPESAKGKAIVLVPEALDATMPVEVLIQLHGYTEGTHRPFAGWRALRRVPRVARSCRRCGKASTRRMWPRCASWLSTRPSSSSKRAVTSRP